MYTDSNCHDQQPDSKNFFVFSLNKALKVGQVSSEEKIIIIQKANSNLSMLPNRGDLIVLLLFKTTLS